MICPECGNKFNDIKVDDSRSDDEYTYLITKCPSLECENHKGVYCYVHLSDFVLD